VIALGIEAEHALVGSVIVPMSTGSVVVLKRDGGRAGVPSADQKS
jgi:hypothetical protein